MVPAGQALRYKYIILSDPPAQPPPAPLPPPPLESPYTSAAAAPSTPLPLDLETGEPGGVDVCGTDVVVLSDSAVGVGEGASSPHDHHSPTHHPLQAAAEDEVPGVAPSGTGVEAGSASSVMQSPAIVPAPAPGHGYTYAHGHAHGHRQHSREAHREAHRERREQVKRAKLPLMYGVVWECDGPDRMLYTVCQG